MRPRLGRACRRTGAVRTRIRHLRNRLASEHATALQMWFEGQTEAERRSGGDRAKNIWLTAGAVASGPPLVLMTSLKWLGFETGLVHELGDWVGLMWFCWFLWPFCRTLAVRGFSR
jgi:hypothetical protein